MNQQGQYLSFLLRLWQETGVNQAGSGPYGDATRGPAQWRASLESPQSGDRLGFASLDDLIAYLRDQTDTSPSAGAIEKE